MKLKIGDNVQGTVWENGKVPHKFKGTVVKVDGAVKVYIRTSKYKETVMEFYPNELGVIDV